MSSLTKGTIAIATFTPAADQTDKEGYGVTLTDGVATLGASATVPHKGVILQGSPTTGKSTVALLGCHEPVPIKLSGTVTKGDFLQQGADGTYLVDAGSGGRVVGAIALEDGISDDIIDAVLLGAPYPLS